MSEENTLKTAMTEETASIEKVCEITLFDAPLIKKLSKSGYFPPAKNGLYNVAATIRGCFRYSKEEREKRGRPQGEHATLPTFDSMEQCTAVAHIPRSAMQMAKKAGCKAFTANNRVILSILLEFIFSTERDEKAIDWSQTFMKEKALREKNRRLKEDGLLADRVIIQRGAGKIMASIFDTLERIFRYEFPVSCVGKNEQEIAIEGWKAICDLRKKLDVEFEKLGIE